MSDVLFDSLGLAPFLLPTLSALGYETPTPIQQKTIPILLKGQDVLAQAQTGTGKTAAFALPILSMIDPALKKPQALVLTPTRELALQVAEAFQSYAKGVSSFLVTPIYGGQGYEIQLRSLKRGSQVVVGTPGRLMDHIRRGTLDTSAFTHLVLDEADEMLRMGFIDDVEWILGHLPGNHQTALFSATMPTSIQTVAKKYLKDSVKVQIKATKTHLDAIEQTFIRVAKHQKLDLLTRLLEIEDVNAAIIFSRTKTGSTELAEKLQARGYSAAALNGDMSQSMREKVIDRLKKSKLDFLIATDVAARGIDVDRISHVINYDIPYDTESYIHRIGRTGRAGRTGKALLFVSQRENHLLRDIQSAVDAPITQMQAPTVEVLKARRDVQLADKITGILEKSKQVLPHKDFINDLVETQGVDAVDVAAALSYLLQSQNPLPSDILIEGTESSGSRSNRSRKPSRARSAGQGSGRPSRSRSGESNGRDRAYKPRRAEGGESSGRDNPRKPRRAEGGESSGRDNPRKPRRAEGGESSGRDNPRKPRRAEGSESSGRDNPRKPRHAEGSESSGRDKPRRASSSDTRRQDKPRKPRTGQARVSKNTH